MLTLVVLEFQSYDTPVTRLINLELITFVFCLPICHSVAQGNLLFVLVRLSTRSWWQLLGVTFKSISTITLRLLA